jgi:hypothetical protein
MRSRSASATAADLNDHFPHRTFRTEAVFQKPDGDPLFIAGVNDMDHISRIASEAVHFGTDDDVIFFSTAKQSLQSFTLVSGPGHHVGKIRSSRTPAFSVQPPERQLLWLVDTLA